MIYLFRRSVSESARDLAEALQVNCRYLHDLGRAHYGHGVRPGDTVIAWGEALPPIQGVRILNGAPLINKMEAAQRLQAAGVSTVQASRTRPPAVEGVDTFPGPLGAYPFNRIQARDMLTRLQAFLATPVPTPITWLGCRLNHIGGADLLTPPTQPEFYVKKENLVEEYRVHCFNGQSIRAGKKGPREGMAQHPWVRSHDGGWRIIYDNFHSKRSMRELAARACTALGLDFGAVDIGRKAPAPGQRRGDLIVLEVNRGPGLEGNTTVAYANAIQQWLTAA